LTPLRPTRASTAGRAYLDLQNLARRTNRATSELQQYYLLECFLDRLTRSSYSGRFVLKGGVLLAAYDTRRPTRDVDLRGHHMAADLATVLQIIREIAAIEIDDGVVFDTGTAHAEVIRDQDQYQGVRVIVTAALATARLVFHVDVNIGDPIVPGPQPVGLPRILGGTLVIAGYPLAMIYAEKIVTCVERGQAKTRWRDFADITLLSRRHDTDGTQLQTAIRAVTAYRHIQITPLSELLDGFPALAQRKWITWTTRQQLRDHLPDDFADVLHTVTGFADPALTYQVTGLTWRASIATWQP
jgi:Nucleotidyl transferase AbiEii toxin, Type IV TA system